MYPFASMSSVVLVLTVYPDPLPFLGRVVPVSVLDNQAFDAAAATRPISAVMAVANEDSAGPVSYGGLPATASSPMRLEQRPRQRLLRRESKSLTHCRTELNGFRAASTHR